MNSYALSLHLTFPCLFDVKELVVTEWPNKDWKEVHTRALLWICRELKVEKLTFTPRLGPLSLTKLAQLAPPVFVFPSRLKYIDSTYREDGVPLIASLLPLVKIVRLNWSLEYLPLGVAASTICLSIVRRLNVGNVFETNYSVRDMTFMNERGLTGLDPDECRAQGICENWTYRNRRVFRRCKKTTLVLLGLSRRKAQLSVHSLFCLAGRDAMNIVISMVWETRDTKVWETWKKCDLAI